MWRRDAHRAHRLITAIGRRYRRLQAGAEAAALTHGYSDGILEFSSAPKIDVYVQFWAELDEDGVIFQMSSGAVNQPTDKYVCREAQELLRDHGFEIGGQVGLAVALNSDPVRSAADKPRSSIGYAQFRTNPNRNLFS
jgi:hypothetical protein